MTFTYKKSIVTGAAGFIGFLSKRLLKNGVQVVGIDNMPPPNYNIKLKENRLELLSEYDGFAFSQIDLADTGAVKEVFKHAPPDVVVNLAAQAGVRYLLTNPHAYVASNLVRFVNILESCRHNRAKHLVFASSSSVYGANTRMPVSVHDNVDHPGLPICRYQEV